MLSVMTCILSKERQKFPGAKVALQSEELKIHCRRRFFDLGAVIRTADQSEFRFVGSPQYNEALFGEASAEKSGHHRRVDSAALHGLAQDGCVAEHDHLNIAAFFIEAEVLKPE
jgi:hypothetical protein